MKTHKQIISAIVLAPVIVLFISLYSIAALFLKDCLSDFLYENFILYIPISILNLLIIITIIILPTVFVTRKFGVKPLHTIGSCFIVYILYTVIPFVPFISIRVTGNIVATLRCISSLREVVSVSIFIGIVMFVTCLITTHRMKKYNEAA